MSRAFSSALDRDTGNLARESRCGFVHMGHLATRGAAYKWQGVDEV